MRPYIYLRAPKRAQGDLRLRFFQARPGGGDPGRPRRQGYPGGDAYGGRQEPLLPGSCADAGEPDGDRLTPDLTDEGPGRLPSPELRNRRGDAALGALAGGALG